MNETLIKDGLQYWLQNSMGERHVFTVTFDVDFEAGNLIDGTLTVNAVDDVMTQVAFTDTHAATLELLRAELQKNQHVFTARITGARQITCKGTPNGATVDVTGPTVTGGINQAIATIATVTAPVFVTVIDAEQNSQLDTDDPERTAPRPAYPYATVQIDSAIKWSSDETRGTDGEGITAMGGQRRATVSVNFYGKNPMDEIGKAINALGTESVRAAFRDSGFAVWVENPGQNLTGLLETRNEPRAFFDLFIGFAENFEDDTGLIEKVENLTGEVSGITVGPIEVDIDP